MRLLFIAFCAFLLMSSVPAMAQDTVKGALDLPEFVARDDGSILSCTDLPSRFADLGPGLVVDDEDGRWIVYEDRRSRQPLRAVAGLVDGMQDELDLCGIAGIQPQRSGLRLPAMGPDGSLMTAPPISGAQHAAKGMHLDLELQVLHDYKIDYRVDWFRDRIAVAPKVRLWWPNGIHVVAQYAFPIRNQISASRSAQYWSNPYPNVLIAGVRRQLNNKLIAAVSGGFFERNRYGSDAQLYWVPQERSIVLGVRVSATGYWGLYEGSWGSTVVDQFAGYLDGTWFIPYKGLRARGRIGSFFLPSTTKFRPGERLVTNPGATGELSRLFGEVELGFFGMYDGEFLRPGFRFALPLSPKKGYGSKRVTAYTTRRMDYPWDLGIVVRGRGTGLDEARRGELFRSELDIWDDLRILHPEMLRVLQ